MSVDAVSGNVYQCGDLNNDFQKWHILPAGDGYYNLQCKGNGKVLDVERGVAIDRQNLIVWDRHNGAGQQFRFVTGMRKFIEEGNYGMSGLLAAGDRRGSYLKYYKIGKGDKKLFLTFSIHGWEDSYAKDGAELTYLAEDFKNYIYNYIDDETTRKWTIYILPALNPDGQNYGWTNNGPGRCTVYQGIDMNRNWSVGFKIDRSARNNTGNSAFSAYESARLRDFILGRQGGSNFLVDVHGWLNETLGDNALGSYYRTQYGLPKHIGSYGSGYLINWARTLRNGRSVLVELPQIGSHSQAVARNYSAKFINATMSLIHSN